MAIFEDVRLCLRVIDFIDNYRRSLRFEAKSYIDTLNAGTVIVNGVPTAATTVVQDIILADRISFGVQSSRYQTLVATSSVRAQLQNGLVALSLESSEAQALVNVLGQATNILTSSPITTSSEMILMAQNILAIVPTFKSVLPEV